MQIQARLRSRPLIAFLFALHDDAALGELPEERLECEGGRGTHDAGTSDFAAGQRLHSK